jgi:sugar lactone lactonase YvrE
VIRFLDNSAVVGLVAVLVIAGVAEAHEGWGVVVHPDGTIYFADIPTNTIWRVKPDGRLEVAIPDRHSHALVRTDDGSIYGTHEYTPQRPGFVWRLAPHGEVTTIATTSRAFEASLHPFLIGADGTLYSTNAYAGPQGPHRLLCRSPSGEVSVVIPQARGIDGLAFGPDQSIYFTDTVALRLVQTDGKVVTIADSLTEPSWGEDLMGLEVDAAGNAYVSDYSGARVLYVNRQGGRTPVFESSWPWSPTGVIHHESAMLVLEHLRMPYVVLGNIGIGPYIRILRVERDGAVHTRAVVWGRHSWLAAAIAAAAIVAVVVARTLRRRRRASLRA